MITTYGKLNEAEQALKAFYSQPMDYASRIVFVRQARAIWDALEACRKFHAGLREAHSTKNEGQDAPMVNSKAAADALNASWANFLSLKIHLDISPISEDALRSVKISPLDHIQLVRLFAE